MKRFLITFFLFFAYFFFLEKGSWFFIYNAAEKEYDKRLENEVLGDFDKDIIILGSSRGANNILTCQLQRETGFSSYNLSYKGTDITFHAYILKTYLKFNRPPKKILLFLDHVHTFNTENTLSFRYDRLSPLIKYNYINDELIKRSKRSYASKVFGLLRLNRKDFNIKKKVILPTDIMSECGSKPNNIRNKNTNEFDFIEYKGTYQSNNELPEKLEAFKAIQKLCEENNIEFISVFSPNYRTFNTSFLLRYQKLLKANNKILIYDTLNPIYKDKLIFSDESHLMLKGAKIFTSESSEYILKSK